MTKEKEETVTWDTLEHVTNGKVQRKLNRADKEKLEETIETEELNSLSSQKQYPQLDSHNRKRRPRLKNILLKMLDYKLDRKNPLTGELEYCSTGELLMLSLVKRGLDGNLKAIELIFDRLEGKAKSALDINADVNMESKTTNTINHDLSSLSIDELVTVKDILKKTATEAMVIEAEDDQ
jgi:hypothetical protein